MKITFLIHNDVFADRITALLERHGVDYFTRWEHVKGKGHGTEAHLGTRSYPSLNTVLMIAFESDGVLEEIVQEIRRTNETVAKPDDHIRLFQVPLERIV